MGFFDITSYTTNMQHLKISYFSLAVVVIYIIAIAKYLSKDRCLHFIKHPWQTTMDFWFKAEPARRLELFGKWFAISFFIYMFCRYLEVYEWLTPDSFYLTNDARKSWHPYILPRLPAYLVIPFGIGLLGSTISYILGYKQRLMAWIMLAFAIYVQSADVISSFTLNKFYVVVFFILALAPSPKAFKDPKTGKTVMLQSAWTLRILQMTVVIQLFTAGTCKIIHGNWIEDPNVLWTQIQGLYRTHEAAFLIRNLPKEAWAYQMYTALAFEALAPLVLIARPLRTFGLIWAMGFFFIILATMHLLTFFMLQMMAFMLLFVEERHFCMKSKKRDDKLKAPVLFFDGVCGLCNRWVDWVMRFDKHKNIKFSPLQSDYARSNLPEELTKDLNTLVYVDGDRIYTKSSAVIRIIWETCGMWSPLLIFGFIPHMIRDFIYDRFKKYRYNFFGKKDACRLPAPEEKERFIEA